MMAGIRAPVGKAKQMPPTVFDANGSIRPRGWGVCVPAQEWARYGVWMLDGVLGTLQPTGWHSWGIWPLSDASGRMPMVFSDRWFDRSATRSYLVENPGCEWLLFNEPELPAQANMTPQHAVDVTMEFIDMARETGMEWQWMAPSVTLDTSHDGLDWLTEYMTIMRRKMGIMRPASWGIHPYTCNSVARLGQSMRKWWDWYEVWGSGAPTIITEVCAEDAPIVVQMAVMDECAAMLQRKEVLGVFWFAACQSESDNSPWQHYALTTLDTDAQTVTLTDLGRHWKELQQIDYNVLAAEMTTDPR